MKRVLGNWEGEGGGKKAAGKFVWPLHHPPPFP